MQRTTAADMLKNFDLNNLDTFEEMNYSHFAKSMSKDEALQIMINTTEGDFSQLSDELREIAELQEEEEKQAENKQQISIF